MKPAHDRSLARQRVPLAPELEQAALLVAQDYRAFVAAAPAPGTHEDPKAFAAHHAAGRAALAHLEQLLKLLRAAAAGGDGSGEEDGALGEAQALLSRVRGQIAALRRGEADGGEADEEEPDAEAA